MIKDATSLENPHDQLSTLDSERIQAHYRRYLLYLWCDSANLLLVALRRKYGELRGVGWMNKKIKQRQNQRRRQQRETSFAEKADSVLVGASLGIKRANEIAGKVSETRNQMRTWHE